MYVLVCLEVRLEGVAESDPGRPLQQYRPLVSPRLTTIPSALINPIPRGQILQPTSVMKSTRLQGRHENVCSWVHGVAILRTISRKDSCAEHKCRHLPPRTC